MARHPTRTRRIPAPKKPTQPDPTPRDEETRRMAKAAGDLTRLILEKRDDWMLERHEMLAVIGYVAAYMTAELATERMLRDRINDAENLFIELFRQHFRSAAEAKRMMRFL